VGLFFQQKTESVMPRKNPRPAAKKTVERKAKGKPKPIFRHPQMDVQGGLSHVSLAAAIISAFGKNR
jgi:hypothetical protein